MKPFLQGRRRHNDAALQLYQVHAVTEGINALGEVTVRISPKDDPRTFGGHGAEPDIVVASIRAYMSALNRMLAALGYGEQQPEGAAATVGIRAG